MEASVSALVRTRQRELVGLAGDVLHHDPRQMLARARERLGTSQTRLERSLERTLRRTGAQLGSFDARLRSLSPLAVLDRGYALVLSADGTVVRSIEQIAKGDRVKTRLSNGEFGSTVDDISGEREQEK
jgi:exodeoxyribonuclease VII large subunit